VTAWGWIGYVTAFALGLFSVPIACGVVFVYTWTIDQFSAWQFGRRVAKEGLRFEADSNVVKLKIPKTGARRDTPRPPGAA
jgi:hypothetical protein